MASGYSGTSEPFPGVDYGPKKFDQIGLEDDFFSFPLANPFTDFGNDVIDASALFKDVAAGQLPSVGLTIYGGPGNDFIRGSQAGDHIAGGSGDDTISGQRGPDHIYGDSGFNVEIITRTLTVPTINVSSFNNARVDDLQAGEDLIYGDFAPGDEVVVGTLSDLSDIIFGDHGQINQAVAVGFENRTAAETKILTVGQIERIETKQPLNGESDTVYGAFGNDIILGGNAGDLLDGGADNNIILGDHGYIDYIKADNDRGDIDEISSTVDVVAFGGMLIADSQIGGSDVITTELGDDIIFGGTNDVGINEIISASDGQNIVFGDNGTIIAAIPDVPRFGAQPITLGRLETIAFAIGGNEVITTGVDKDIILAGVANDLINSNAGNDIVIGDNGFVDYVVADGNPTDIDIISTNAPTIGGKDTISSGSGNDFVFGGTDEDIIAGDADNDLIFGDHGMVTGDVDANLLPLNLVVHPFAFTSIDTQTSHLGGNDLISGDQGEDIILGGQGDDTITGNQGDDDIFGGHNVVGGHDGNDIIDGGSENDVIAGDNAAILRTGTSISPRMQVLANGVIYNSQGEAQITGVPQVNPTGAVERFVTLLDHSSKPAPGTFGNDYIAGGTEDDVIFGQLGDDIIQGDGSIATRINGGIPVGAMRLDNGFGTLVVQPSFETANDGEDYIEGNGGDDIIFGNLGQDDIIGGSSSLFGLATPNLRPDGDDILFGGAGTRIDRNRLGQSADSTRGLVAEHAFDADYILGDNGNLYRLVDGNAHFLTFNYDLTSDIGNNAGDPFAPHDRGDLRIIPRAYVLLDYTPGDNNSGIGGSDLVKGEDSDDVIHGMRGNDVLYGDSWDDDIYGGTGSDKIFGGSGEDGIIADDGLIKTSRNGVAEPLYGITVNAVNQLIELTGPFIGAVVDLDGFLKKTVDLTIGNGPIDTWQVGGDDIVYGGLGDDWIHAGAGDDAASGAEALANFYNDTRAIVVSPLVHIETGEITHFYDPFTQTFRPFYDPDNPRTKIAGFILNFDAFDGNGIIHDGKDWIFGDIGNDVLFGGTGHDRLFGGFDDDYLQLDDNLETNGGLNDIPDAAFDANDPDIQQKTAGAGDFAYGGAGLDVLIANTGHDRMFDWTGEFNSFIVPFSQFGSPTVNRLVSPHVKQFLLDLGAAAGADPDPDLVEPFGELGLMEQQDEGWNDQHGGPRDPQPGNGHARIDSQGGKENTLLYQPLQTVHGSTPLGGNNVVIVTPVQVEKLLHAPTLGIGPEDADTAPGVSLPVGTPVFWTYQVFNNTEFGAPLTILSIRDDAGTPGNPSDDFLPRPILEITGQFNVGDLNQDGLPGCGRGVGIHVAGRGSRCRRHLWRASGCRGAVHQPGHRFGGESGYR
jgi:Ca2+-binding RTX toxin-like protein